jgi:hypothetical protein
LEHTAAAERLVVMLGPDSLQHEIIGQLFYSIRSHAVIRAAIFGHYSVFSEPQWQEKNIPLLDPGFRSAARSDYDILVEYILRLACVVHGRTTTTLPMSVECLLSELETLYSGFLTAQKRDIETAPLLVQANAEAVSRPPSLAGRPFAAMTMSYFHAAAIFLSTQLVTNEHRAYDLRHNASVILAATEILSSSVTTNGTAILRMTLPVSLVWCHVGDKAIKQQVSRTYKAWSRREGMSGLCALAFPQGAPASSRVAPMSKTVLSICQ